MKEKACVKRAAEILHAMWVNNMTSILENGEFHPGGSFTINADVVKESLNRKDKTLDELPEAHVLALMSNGAYLIKEILATMEPEPKKPEPKKPEPKKPEPKKPEPKKPEPKKPEPKKPEPKKPEPKKPRKKRSKS